MGKFAVKNFRYGEQKHYGWPALQSDKVFTLMAARKRKGIPIKGVDGEPLDDLVTREFRNAAREISQKFMHHIVVHDRSLQETLTAVYMHGFIHGHQLTRENDSAVTGADDAN